MKRSQQITLLCVSTIISGFLGGCSDHHQHLRQRHLANGELMYDQDGNPIYEDDDKQSYTYSGGSYYPWYTRANGYSTIPGSGVAAPDVSGGVSEESAAGHGSDVSRGGFGETGEAHSSSAGGAHGGGGGEGE
jgi:hypothetical protein